MVWLCVREREPVCMCACVRTCETGCVILMSSNVYVYFQITLP